jgi:hypothetical protein
LKFRSTKPFWFFLPFIIHLLLPGKILGQQHFRIKADFSIKEKNADSTVNLTVGTVYYDKVIKKVIYDVSFPRKETWIIQDTAVYKIVNGKVIEKVKATSIAEFTIFHMALSGSLGEYGLKEMPFKLTSVEKEDSMIIATWKPEEKVQKMFGKIVMSKVNRKIYGIVFFKSNGKIAGKQFFRKYKKIAGVDFPTEVMQINYTPSGTNQQITSFKNIVIDQANDKKLFDRAIPAH